MSEQDEIIADLDGAGVLEAVRWAYASGTARALEVYSEADGHDATLLGILRHTLLRDRLDRVFACGKYAPAPDADPASALDLLYVELSDRDIASMPTLAPGLVIRSDLNHSPGWAWERTRFLLAAFVSGELDRMPWPRKSRTKQRVARQPAPDSNQLSLLDGVTDDEIDGFAAVLKAAHELDLRTFVVAHSLDPWTGKGELVLGRPRLNADGGRAWHWHHDLLPAPPSGGGRRDEERQGPSGPSTVPDAAVRLRAKPAARSGDQAGGAR
ncbi:hypothetical protein E0F15_20435 [Frankia sp. B2]|uniref:hypothetical protein n=1 Tax=unclassified Frankia TaxID=2632575 RepID=UPI0006CA2B2C|nr:MULTISPECIES: hypothetical protein [unclassified Frankia]KPM56918.1 hypothetical protein ACG83_03550 [Frankia sp. R43]TFE25093.1 hypothetical protein E0F15_20435 [Frankia sp. B2]